uniref:Calcium-activated chloride channel N-terminal domain-containing protein n=1 Tax=Graphocephala atropunctata TaxID=36148 RepID=A0A1B6L3U4_9HEMI
MAFSVFCVLVPVLAVYSVSATPITMVGTGYEGITVTIDATVPAENCGIILANLEVAASSASQALYHALDGRAHWSSLTVLLPSHWPDSCVPAHIPVPSQGETPDIRVGATHPVYGDTAWTQQSRPCGQQGDFIYLSHRLLLEPRDVGRMLLREWAKYRYGVFDEVGYSGDGVYPSCYHGDLTQDIQINGCSDKPLQHGGECHSGMPLNVSHSVHPDAKSSLLFTTEPDHITSFCNSITHDRFAPTKHNSLCGHRSITEVILNHRDFQDSIGGNTGVNTTPNIVYKRATLTRYVVVIEDTKDMLIRESWSFLRLALRKWAVHDLPSNTEVGLVSANESNAQRLRGLSPLQSPGARDLVASNIPYTPGDTRAPACLSCGIKEAIQMLQDKERMGGPAASIIVVIAPGTSEHAPELEMVIEEASDANMRIATITYPAQLRSRPLDWLANATGGAAYTVNESRYNMAASFLSTYFKLTNVMWNMMETYYQGDVADLPIEIHRRELLDDGRNSVTGSFVLEEWLGEAAKFFIFTHNTENPLIRGVSLVSPSHRVFSTRSDSLLSLKLLSLPANINETGTWTYNIERFSGSPQPHYVQVMATPWTRTAPVVRARLWTSETNNPFILYTEVKRGDWPVLGARVEVTVTRPETNGSGIHREKFELLDTGSGDPDLMKGDGIYSRYFSPSVGGPGVYTFEVTVTDNGNTAYSWQHEMRQPGRNLELSPNCCGSLMPTPSVEPLSPFQRVLPPITVSFNKDVVMNPAVVGRVGDLKAEILPSELKARLSWTAPDMGGTSVTRYEVKYALTIGEILDSFDSATAWTHATPFPLAPGSETSFTIDLTRNPSLLDQTLFVAVRGFKDQSPDAIPGPVSNWVRVLVPSPPPPPPPVPTYPSSPTEDIWPQPDESVIPRIADRLDFNLELILPVIIGIILLALCLTIYCYLCIIRRKKPEKSSQSSSQHPEKPLNVSIVPTTPTSNANISISTPIMNSPTRSEPDTRTMSPQFEPCLIDPDDPKKRYSMAQYNDTHMMTREGVVPNSNGHLSVISANHANHHQNGTLVRGRTLSPYQSWTASQLLHEHERRHSPYGQVGEEYLQQEQQYAPPVPPLPSYNQQDIYGNHQQQTVPPPGQFINGYHRNGNLMLFNPSLQGSLSSVSSGDRKKRNVTMV